MKKSIIFSLLMIISASQLFAQSRYISQSPYVVTYTYTRPVYRVVETRTQPQDEYILDRKVKESYWNRDPITFGFVTRAGYAFNYKAVTYGASLIYSYNGNFGITAGFDGYYLTNGTTVEANNLETGETQPVNARNLPNVPLWDIRFGFVYKKIAIGGIFGDFNLGDEYNNINPVQSPWFTGIYGGGRYIYGGFITFLLPVSKYVGFNIDFAFTNKTGINACGGINITLPYKERK